ncbi:tyrosine-type recombinase/integrase [Candidatus Margulisiibacteriota bacterium]
MKENQSKFLSSKEIAKIRNYLQKESESALIRNNKVAIKNQCIFEILFGSGARVSEIARLKIAHLNLNKNTPSIFIERGKWGSSGVVWINENLRILIKRYIKWKKERGYKVSDNDYLFDSNNKHISTRAIQYSFKKLINSLGISMHYSVHSIRHSYASHLYAKSKDIVLVSKQLRHSRVSTTQDIYTAILPEIAVKAVSCLYKK